MKAVLTAPALTMAILVATHGLCQSAKESTTKQSQTPAPTHARGSQDLFDRYFPFRVGQVRSYIVRGESEEGSGQDARSVAIRGEYSETVLSVRNIAPAIRIVEVKIVGSGPYPTDCSNAHGDKTQPVWTFWYVAHDNRVFVECTRERVDNLVTVLRASPTGQTSEDGPAYQLPFEIGATWGADPDAPKREDTFYEWSVEDKVTAKVPAGKFEGCYQMIYRTMPDHSLQTVCPGVGFVAEEYMHHGTVNQYRIELAKVTTPAKSTK
jgi:hypothetical protein